MQVLAAEVQPVSETMATVAPPVFDLSALGLFMQADPVVKGVMIVLFLASIACWAIIFEKAVRFVRLRREVAAFEAALRAGASAPPSRIGAGACGAILAAGRRAVEERIEGESFGDMRERCERTMRAALATEVRAVEPGLSFLATVGSTSPFVGLFGTVWGIMNSFGSIAQSNDTSLAVVAPGIAEALFATALGLVAAIPAVVAYNKLTTNLGHLSQRLSASVVAASSQLLRRGALHAAPSRAAE
jgi:TolQ protein